MISSSSRNAVHHVTQGRDAFQGKEIIANDLTTENLGVARDREVVVIGSGKTAWDTAGAAAEFAASVTLLGRQV
jgi:cation diffusion facilitator CzcD-associated flavoprotein CzcO